MALTTKELQQEDSLKKWAAGLRASYGGLAATPGSSRDVDTDALRRYLATDGTTASNLEGKLQVLTRAGDPRLSRTAQALLMDPAALDNLEGLYAAQDARMGGGSNDDDINASAAASEAARMPAEPMGQPNPGSNATVRPDTPNQVADQQLGAVDDLDSRIAEALGLIGTRQGLNPYDVNTSAGKSNFDRLAGQARLSSQIEGLGYERGIQGDASARGMLQAGTTGAKMAAAEGFRDAAVANAENQVGAQFLDKATDFDSRLFNDLMGIKTSTAPTNVRLGALDSRLGQLNLESGRTIQGSQFDRSFAADQEARDRAERNSSVGGWGDVATAAGTIGGTILAGPVGAAIGGAVGKVAGGLFNQQPPPAARPSTSPYQSDPTPGKTYGLASVGSEGAPFSQQAAGYFGTPSNSMRPNDAAPSLRFPKSRKAAWA